MSYRYVVHFDPSKKSGNFDDFFSRLVGNFSDQANPTSATIKTGTGGNYFFHYPETKMPEADVENIARIGGKVVGGPFDSRYL